MDPHTKRIMRWTLALTEMTARLGERKYISHDATKLLTTTDAILAEMIEALGMDDMPVSADDQESFDEYTARVAS